MGRSIAAVVAGLVTLFALLMVADTLAWVWQTYAAPPPDSAPYPEGLLLTMVVLALPAGLLAGALTARAARRLPWQHGLTLACLTALALAANLKGMREGLLPPWYLFCLPVVASLAALAGAVLAGPGQHPPPAPSPAQEPPPAL